MCRPERSSLSRNLKTARVAAIKPRRRRRGITGATLFDRDTHDPASLAANEFHVVGVGADVLSGDVATLEGVDDAPVGAPQTLRLHLARVTNDDRLATAEVEPRCGCLERHRTGETQDVFEGFRLRGIGEKAGPAEGGTESGGVDGDDRLEAGHGIRAEYHLLVSAITERAENTHGGSFLGQS